jgi:hypothetical protein
MIMPHAKVLGAKELYMLQHPPKHLNKAVYHFCFAPYIQPGRMCTGRCCTRAIPEWTFQPSGVFTAEIIFDTSPFGPYMKFFM